MTQLKTEARTYIHPALVRSFIPLMVEISWYYLEKKRPCVQESRCGRGWAEVFYLDQNLT